MAAAVSVVRLPARSAKLESVYKSISPKSTLDRSLYWDAAPPQT